MKENKAVNEAFVKFHEDLRAEGKSDKEIEVAAIKHFKLGGSDPGHTYRAMKARLADPKKYGGIYSERMKKFQKLPKKAAAVKTNGGDSEPTVVKVEAAGGEPDCQMAPFETATTTS